MPHDADVSFDLDQQITLTKRELLAFCRLGVDLGAIGDYDWALFQANATLLGAHDNISHSILYSINDYLKHRRFRTTQEQEGD